MGQELFERWVGAIRVQDDGSVALSYATPGHDWPKLLEFLDLKD